MNTREFLSVVWPQSGPYCIAAPWVTPDGKKVYAHSGCKTLDDAMVYIAKHRQSKDLYFAPHTLKVRRELNPKTGKLQTFRTHANMKEARAFFFDIDCGGPDDYYTTLDEALGALEKFLFETCLPSPFVVCSGYGIHVYWIIDAPIESLTWREPAARLFWLAQQHELHVDPSRTTDQSSVLRVPGTFNLKDPANPRKVTILAEGVVTGEFLVRLVALTAGYAPDIADSDSQARDGFSVAWDGRRPPADEVAAVCEHMRTFRDSQGNIPEPQWHMSIGTIKHCDDGATKVHEWSSGYPGYTQAETQAKLDAWTLPPPGCEKINEKSGDPAICARCPYKDLAKNPVLIANVVYQNTHQSAFGPTNGVDPTPPCDPPAPYKLDMTYGIIEKKKKGVICEWPMFPIHWITATSNETCLSRWYAKLRNGWKIIEFLNEELNSRIFADALRNKGITLGPKQIKGVYAFMLAYLNELQKYQNSLDQFDYVGWEVAPQESTQTPVVLGDPEWFVLYGRKISVVDGSVVPCIMTRNTRLDYMNRVGSLRQQIALMNFYNASEYMAQQFVIAASLACPFFRFSNLHGMMVCLSGDTGASKSTGAYFAASIWGHPELYVISGLETNSTYKGRQERGHITRNLPFIIDEITKFDKETASEITLSASQPGSYTSLKSNRDFRGSRGGYKSNLTICTSNTSLVQMVNADSSGGQAGIMRVFEIKVDRNTVHSKAEADTTMRLLVKNYGCIGEDFLCKCLPHTREIGEEFLKIQQQLETDINASQEERYMTACAAIALLGIKLGKNLGYFQFSYKRMRDWLINVQIPIMRGVAKTERIRWASETILGEYLEEINPFMCRVKENAHGEPEIIYAPPTIEIKARYEIPKKELHVRTESFRDYCDKRRYNYSRILDELYANKLITHKSIRKRMRTELNTYSNPVSCFVVPVKASSPIAVPNKLKPADAARKIVEFKKR